MFSGFNVKLKDKTIFTNPSRFEDHIEHGFNYYYKKGKECFEQYKTIVHEDLKYFIYDTNNLNGNLMSKDWFPEIDADIFLSHSHADENLAISFSGWLNETFGLCVFIDSEIWGYSNKLLKIIDNKYCKNYDGNYSYEKRNFSTSHVHYDAFRCVVKND
jgi:hypothetical protein